MSVFTLDLPESLIEKLKKMAEKDQIPPEQFAVIAIAEKLAVLSNDSYLETRAKRADIKNFELILSRVPDVEPEDFDKIK